MRPCLKKERHRRRRGTDYRGPAGWGVRRQGRMSLTIYIKRSSKCSKVGEGDN